MIGNPQHKRAGLTSLQGLRLRLAAEQHQWCMVHLHHQCCRCAVDTCTRGSCCVANMATLLLLPPLFYRFALSILLLYVAAVIYYLYVRIAFTLDMKDKW